MYKTKKSIIIVFCLFILGVSLFPMNGLAYIVEPPPGGSLKPSIPHLDYPPSPDYDGKIILTWSSSARAAGYILYRSTSYSGGYQPIVTTTQLSYTDQVATQGYWYYKVKAYNNYGSTTSRKVYVEVIGPPSDPAKLIGSTQRFFPHEEPSKLGFTIFSLGTISIPTIWLSITETEVFNGNVHLRIFIDGMEIYHVSRNFDTNIPIEFYTGAYNLRVEGTYQIVVELSNLGPNDIYRLECLEIHNLHLREYELVDGITCGPTQIFGFGPYFGEEECDYDKGYIAVDSILPFTASSEGEINTYCPSFCSSIVAEWAKFLDNKDYTPKCCVWIDVIKIQYRIIKPDGTSLIDNRMEESGAIRTSHSGSSIISPEIKIILDFISMGIDIAALFTSWADILLPVEWVLTAIGWAEGGDSDDYYYLQDGWYEGFWENGDVVAFTALKDLAKQISMRYYWSANLPQPSETVSVEDIAGPYQVQVSWIVKIRGGNGPLHTWQCMDFMNFIYNPPA